MYNTIFDPKVHILPTVTKDTLLELAKNPNTPIEILEGIWENMNFIPMVHSEVLAGLAQNPNTPVNILKQIWEDTYYEGLDFNIISGIVHNPSTPVEILQVMSEDQYIISNLDLVNDQSLPYKLAFQMLRNNYMPEILNSKHDNFHFEYYQKFIENCLISLNTEKNQLIIDFLTSSCPNIRRELSYNDKILLINTLKGMSEEQLFVAFDILQKIDNEESKKLTCSKVLIGVLTFDKIHSKIKEAMQQAETTQMKQQEHQEEFTSVSKPVITVVTSTPELPNIISQVSHDMERITENKVTSESAEQELTSSSNSKIEEKHSDTFVSRHFCEVRNKKGEQYKTK